MVAERYVMSRPNPDDMFYSKSNADGSPATSRQGVGRSSRDHLSGRNVTLVYKLSTVQHLMFSDNSPRTITEHSNNNRLFLTMWILIYVTPEPARVLIHHPALPLETGSFPQHMLGAEPDLCKVAIIRPLTIRNAQTRAIKSTREVGEDFVNIQTVMSLCARPYTE
ncbi:hypothetical protein J6590_017085 [Homalodisca vitripennis]|nr:hypothetical protein J6590_017085 [Homalodisca vitripennis]